MRSFLRVFAILVLVFVLLSNFIVLATPYRGEDRANYSPKYDLGGYYDCEDPECNPLAEDECETWCDEEWEEPCSDTDFEHGWCPWPGWNDECWMRYKLICDLGSHWVRWTCEEGHDSRCDQYE